MGWASQTEEELHHHLAEGLFLFPAHGFQLTSRISCRTCGDLHRGGPFNRERSQRESTWYLRVIEGAGLLPMVQAYPATKSGPHSPPTQGALHDVLGVSLSVGIITPLIWTSSISTLGMSMTWEDEAEVSQKHLFSQ